MRGHLSPYEALSTKINLTNAFERVQGCVRGILNERVTPKALIGATDSPEVQLDMAVQHLSNFNQLKEAATRAGGQEEILRKIRVMKEDLERIQVDIRESVTVDWE